MANNEKTENTSVGEDVEQLQFSHTTRFPATLAKDLVVSYKAKHILNHKPWHSNPTLRSLSKRNENVCPYKDLYIVFITAIPKSPQRETILMSINW